MQLNTFFSSLLSLYTKKVSQETISTLIFFFSFLFFPICTKIKSANNSIHFYVFSSLHLSLCTKKVKYTSTVFSSLLLSLCTKRVSWEIITTFYIFSSPFFSHNHQNLVSQQFSTALHLSPPFFFPCAQRKLAWKRLQLFIFSFSLLYFSMSTNKQVSQQFYTTLHLSHSFFFPCVLQKSSSKHLQDRYFSLLFFPMSTWSSPTNNYIQLYIFLSSHFLSQCTAKVTHPTVTQQQRRNFDPSRCSG